MTKTKVTEKFRSGASVPLRPDQIVTPSRNTPISPQIAWVTGLRTATDSHRGPGRQCVSSNRLVCHANESTKNEMIRTTDAPQANSQSGIGRSCRPTSAWATT